MCECCKKSCIIWSLSPFYIIAIVFNILSIKIIPYNREEYDVLRESWKKSPITSISFNQDYLNQLNGTINRENVKEFNKALILERLGKKYNYKYLLREDVNEPGFHPCGRDEENNFLFLPNDIECPINELKFSFNSETESDKEEYNYYYHYKTVKFYGGIYLHYSNENINSTMLTDIDFELGKTVFKDYDIGPFRQVNFTSRKIIEEGYTLYLIMKNYIGFSLNPMKDGKRDLSEFKAFLYYDNKLYLNIASLILLFISFITLIIDNTTEGGQPIFQIITTIFLYIQIVFQIIIFKYYGEIKQIDTIMWEYYQKSLFPENFEYNTVVLSFVVIITGFYLSLTNHRENDGNYYFYLVICFRYNIFNKCCNECERRFERNKIIKKEILREEIKKLEDKISEYDSEKRNLIDENKNIRKEIENKSNILNNMKNEENSFWNINEEEENKFEIKFQQLMKDNELNIRKFKNLKNQINGIEKEINYYKIIEFKQELNNK